MKVNISIDDDLMSRIDNYADKNYMSRSGLMSFACNQFLNNAELSFAITEMGSAMRKIADSGEFDDETIKQLEDFQRIVKMVTAARG